MLSITEFKQNDWTELGIDPYQNEPRAENALNGAFWKANPRPSTAPTALRVSQMLRERVFDLDTNADTVARRTGIEGSTIGRIIAGTHSPTYLTLVKVCAALGIELTITPPGQALPRTPRPGAEPPDPASLEERAPSPDELREMVTERLTAIDKLLRNDRAKVAKLRGLDGLKPDTIKNIMQRHLPLYEQLRTLLGGIELDLVIKPWSEPLTEELRHTRFSTKREWPIRHIKDHDAGINLSQEPITAAAATADEDGDGHFYVISPDDRMAPSGIVEGDYCLASKTEQPTVNLPRTWIRLADDTQMLCLAIDSTPPTVEDDRSAKLRFIRWGTAENDWNPKVLEIAASDVAERATIIAAYDGRPTVERTPNKRTFSAGT